MLKTSIASLCGILLVSGGAEKRRLVDHPLLFAGPLNYLTSHEQELSYRLNPARCAESTELPNVLSVLYDFLAHREEGDVPEEGPSSIMIVHPTLSSLLSNADPTALQTTPFGVDPCNILNSDQVTLNAVIGEAAEFGDRRLLFLVGEEADVNTEASLRSLFTLFTLDDARARIVRLPVAPSVMDQTIEELLDDLRPVVQGPPNLHRVSLAPPVDGGAPPPLRQLSTSQTTGEIAGAAAGAVVLLGGILGYSQLGRRAPAAEASAGQPSQDGAEAFGTIPAGAEDDETRFEIDLSHFESESPMGVANV